ncbi:MAG: oligopeptide transporter, OPT family [bacterium]|nr:oligopeptide transporter, OPT family [bacterium]
MEEFKPYVPDDTNLKEFTIKAIVSGAIFGIIFGAANAYVGLYIGLTVSTSIPLAVIAVAWLKMLQPLLGKPTVLEYNQVQTAGSASSSLASGVIFTIPALFLWGFNPGIFQMGMLALLGGILGILFMIPLRKFLIVKEHGTLPYPEGIATSKVLISADIGGSKAKNIFYGMGVGALFKFIYGFLGVWVDKVYIPIPVLTKAELGIKPWPLLMGIGYILNFKIAAIMVSGGMISWLGIIPIIAYFGENLAAPMLPETVLPIAAMSAEQIWDKYIRFIGAGAVAAAGIITVVKAMPVMYSSLVAGVKQLKSSTRDNNKDVPRTQKDLPMSIVLIGVIAVIIVLALTPKILGIGVTPGVRVIAAVCIAIFAFCFVTVSSRIVGLVGVTSNPTSGMTIVTLLGTASVFYLFGWTGDIGKTTALTVGTVVAIAASIAGDTSQDLKCGYIVGAQPSKQQIAELIGVLTSAFFIVAAVWLLGTVYTFGSADLPAPQATLIKTVIEGVMQADLPWGLVLTGVTFGIVAELLGIPSLAFAVGMYIPLSTWTPIFVGGVIRYFVEKSAKGDEELRKHKEEEGVLLGSGFVAGEGILAVIISFYAYIVGHKPETVGWALSGNTSKVVSLLAFAAVGWFLVQMTRKKPVKA